MNQYKNIAKAKAIERKNRERLLKVNPKLKDFVEWEEKTGINAKCLLNRKDMGWDIEKILTTPISKKRGGKIDNS